MRSLFSFLDVREYWPNTQPCWLRHHTPSRSFYATQPRLQVSRGWVLVNLQASTLLQHLLPRCRTVPLVTLLGFFGSRYAKHQEAYPIGCMRGAWAECAVLPIANTARRCAVMSIFSTCICDRFCRALENLFRFIQSRRVRLELSLAMSSSIASTRPSSRVLHWVTLATALSFSSCRPPGGLPMDRESEQPDHATDSASSPASSLGSHVDDSARLWRHPGLTSAAELAAAPSPAGSVETASFTDDFTLLEPCKDQMCGEITIAPGTVRRIPYVIPSGWHYAE